MSASDPIIRIRLHHCVQEMSVSYATDARQTVDALIVELSTATHSGWGEVFMPRVEPLWNWAVRVSPRLLGCVAAGLDLLLEQWPTDRPKLSLQECSTYCHPEVDCVAEAVSIALHDLHAQQRGVRFADLLGPIARTEIPGMPVVTLGPIELMAAEASDWRAQGVSHLKIKLSGTADRDVSIIQGIRAAVGPGLNLQADANGAYESMSTALPVIAALNAADVAVIEDLFHIGNADCVRAARRLLQGQTMLDKECYWPHVQQVLAAGLVDLINQHPHNQGSMTNALRIACAARTAGVENAIGSSGIFGIQNTAFLHLAAVTGLTRPCEDIGLHTYYDSPVRTLFRFGSRPTVLRNPVTMVRGQMKLPAGPGLGVEIDREALGRVTAKTFVLGG
ncbi:MAG: mandelate racemase/muconate lactonizing enzyme family protein [Opitutaceae bacterium]|nr:mandelate racemase/muconate lactonizing enzyme family protein [Opitutaceae bacterium]MBP9911896.1 mandelate racemase/muconate lactonizing enzyme family protein [Opitutaceae bacterium]